MTTDDGTRKKDDVPQRILVTGVTGYIGGRLAPRLLEAGYRVRVLVREKARLAGRPWFDEVEIAIGDALHSKTLEEAMRDVDTAFFLLHSQRGGPSFLTRNIKAAEHFAAAARSASLRHIIFLGGLGDEKFDRSGLLSSQRRSAEILRRSGIPLTEFRSGSPTAQTNGDLFHWAEELLVETRLLMDSPVAQDPDMGGLFADLELVLAQIVQISHNREAQEREWIEDDLENRNLFARLRTKVPAGH